MDANAQTSKGDCGTCRLTDTPQGNVALRSDDDSEREETALIKEDHSGSKKDNVCTDSEKSPARPVESEDTNMNQPSIDREESTDMEVQEGTSVGLSPENQTDADKVLGSSADDLDEMMDIGTVDQLDQEAQMTEPSTSLEEENAQVVSNAGKVIEGNV